MHTIRSILKISSRRGLQRRGGTRTLEDDGFDSRAMGKLTRFPESYIASLHASYINITGNARRSMQLHHWQKLAKQLGFKDSFIIRRMFETFDVCRKNTITFVEMIV